LKCLLAASKIDASNPIVHEQIIRFKLAIDAASSSLKPQTAEVIKSEFTLLPGSTSLPDYNSSFLSKNKISPRHVYAGLRVKHLLPSHDQSKNETEIFSTLDSTSIRLEEATEGLDLLKSWKSSKVDDYKTKAAAKWPEATIFQSSKN
jgi:hypothetical protein